MENLTGYISTAVTVFLFIGAVLKYSIIDPLERADKHNTERWNEAKTELQKQAQENKKNIELMRSELKEISNKTLIDENNTKNGLERLTKLENRVNNLLENCRNCNNLKR